MPATRTLRSTPRATTIPIAAAAAAATAITGGVSGFYNADDEAIAAALVRTATTLSHRHHQFLRNTSSVALVVSMRKCLGTSNTDGGRVHIVRVAHTRNK